MDYTCFGMTECHDETQDEKGEEGNVFEKHDEMSVIENSAG